MYLADVRRLCIRRQLRVTFIDSRGERCCINEHGATIRGGIAGWLQSDEEFAQISRFEVAFAGETRPRQISRGGLERLAAEFMQSADGRGTAGKRLSLLQFQ